MSPTYLLIERLEEITEILWICQKYPGEVQCESSWDLIMVLWNVLAFIIHVTQGCYIMGGDHPTHQATAD